MQVNNIKRLLFPSGTESEALQSLREQLAEVRQLATEPPGPGVPVKRYEAAFCVEKLLAKGGPSPQSLVFLKTFKRPDAISLGMVEHEISICCSRQPDLCHENVCGMSRASFGAFVETRLEGHGWVGLLARLPFVAMENCDGCDLFDFFACKALRIPHELQELAGAADAKAVNEMLRAAADFNAEAQGHLDRARRTLQQGGDRDDFARKLALFAAQLAEAVPAVTLQAVPDAAEALTACPRVPWSEMGSMATLRGLPFPYGSSFASFSKVVSWLNDLVESAKMQNPDLVLNRLNNKKWKFVTKSKSEVEMMKAEGRKILPGLFAVASQNLERQSLARWGNALFIVWPDLQELAALEGLQHILALILDWRWQAAHQALMQIGIGNFGPESVGASGRERDEAAVALVKIAAEHVAARARFLQRICTAVSGDGLYPGLPGRLVKISTALIAHVVTSRGARLRGMFVGGMATTDAPAGQGVKAARAIFIQATRALRRLHQSGSKDAGGRVHGDVKLENFNLTPQGLVKLLDFGYMLDLGTDVRGRMGFPPYCSPQVSRLSCASMCDVLVLFYGIERQHRILTSDCLVQNGNTYKNHLPLTRRVTLLQKRNKQGNCEKRAHGLAFSEFSIRVVPKSTRRVQVKILETLLDENSSWDLSPERVIDAVNTFRSPGDAFTKAAQARLERLAREASQQGKTLSVKKILKVVYSAFFHTIYVDSNLLLMCPFT